VSALAPVGVVVALAEEARALSGRRVAPLARATLAGGVRLAVAGMGRERAEHAASELVRGGARALLSFGVAGGLDPGLRAGALLAPARVRAADGELFEVDPAWRAWLLARLARAAPCPADLLEGRAVVAEPAAKACAFRASGAAAVDLESAAVARVARDAGLPFAVLRAVCDAADETLPDAALRALDADGRARPGALLRSLARDPRQVAALVRLRRSFLRAQRSLARAARLVGPVLAPAEEVVA
jgi:adenosylhomocysteine nucleosidase